MIYLIELIVINYSFTGTDGKKVAMRFMQREGYFSLLATNVKGLVKRIIGYGLNCFEQLFGLDGYGH